MPGFRGRLARLRTDAGRWGWARTISRRLAGKIGSLLGVSIAQIRERRLDDDVPPINGMHDLELRELSVAELLVYPDLREIQLSEEFLRAAAARGDRIFAALKDGRIVGYSFRAVGGGPHTDGIWVVTRPDSAYAFKSFVTPDFRGRRISPALVLLGDNAMRDAGCSSRIGFVAVSNLASLRVGKRVGSRVVGYAGYLKRFGIRVTFRTPGARSAGFEFSFADPASI